MHTNQARYQRVADEDPLVVPPVDDPCTDDNEKRGLQERHLSMIALAGMIGTGLFLSSGRALAHAGPLGCVLAFLLMGTVTACMAYISAEMSAFKPVEGGFTRHAAMWLDRSSGIAIGWNFWYSMAVTMPTEISAATTLLSYWKPDINHFISIRLDSCAGGNRRKAMTLTDDASAAIALIVCFVIGGLVLDLGGIPNREHIGFRYWSEPYNLFHEYMVPGFRGRFLGFWSAMISAAFAYGNVQVVAIAGAEARNPRQTIPGALRKTFARVVVFYVASIVVISLTIPSTDRRLEHPTGTVVHSPFVLAFSGAGLKAIPSIVTAVVFSSAFSSGNACSFIASRTLHGLAIDGHAPSFFLPLNRHGVPYRAVAASTAWGAIAYASLHHGAFQAFVMLVSLVTTAGIVSWVVLCLTYLRFFKAMEIQGISREELPYRSPFQPYITYYALFVNISVLTFSGWDTIFPEFDLTGFLSNYANCLLYPVLYFGCKLWFKDTPPQLTDIDIEGELELIESEGIRT
ncbi:amino acid permease [Agrocybe pediades]|nr:amino acid permease [Agrocybe pediades]